MCSGNYQSILNHISFRIRVFKSDIFFIYFTNFNGINKDISSYEVEPNKWTDGNNIEFDNDKTKKILGHKQVFGTLSGTPYFLLYHRNFNDDYWIYADLNKIYTANQVGGSTTHTDVTRTTGGDYSATAA